MKIKIFVVIFSLFQTVYFGCGQQSPEKQDVVKKEASVVEVEEKPDSKINESSILVGASKLEEYISKLEGKAVGMVVNHTSMVGEKHLVDLLLENNIDIKKIYAPEHGFRGKADAGEKIKDGKDSKTGIPLTSLYGKKRKPGKEDLEGLDLIIFDIQDVGARFYTYISTMSLVMEACAENNIPVLILDRPNPNGHYVDGPVLQKEYSSFVGMHEVPVVHGMTIAEYARMINQEGWLKDGVKCDLSWVTCDNYDHTTFYELPIKPSPNLPNMTSIYFYPSLCFFEGTTVNVGRGTKKQFQVYGSPDYRDTGFSYTPQSMPGAKYPKHEGKLCHGYDYSDLPHDFLRNEQQFSIKYIWNFYHYHPNKENFFLDNNFFDKLAGSDRLKKQLLAGMNHKEISASWKEEVEDFKKIRSKYLLYEDFE